MSASPPAVPESMIAGVYSGRGQVAVQRLPVPGIGPGELLVRVEACGICHTDLKKIQYDLLPPPRVYGHETAGVVVAAGPGAEDFKPGERVCLFHHIPCLKCFYCARRDYAQCETYKRVGVTAGFEPAGGGFAQYVRVLDWIVKRGVVRLPDHVTFDRASFVEPVNTCLKAVEKAAVQPDETVLVMGQGPIGLLFTMLLHRNGVAALYGTDLLASRLDRARELGAKEAWDPSQDGWGSRLRSVTQGRGADVVIVAASAPGIVEQAVEASRPGARILLFAQTAARESFQLSGSSICVEERTLLGSYSASVDLQQQAAEIVWEQSFPVEQLISHRLPLQEMGRGIELASRPSNGSLKLIVHPQRKLS